MPTLSLNSITHIEKHLKTSLQESGKRHGTQKQNVLSIKFHNKSWATFDCQIISWWSSAKGYPGFVVEFNNYSISGDDRISLTSLLHGAPQITI